MISFLATQISNDVRRKLKAFQNTSKRQLLYTCWISEKLFDMMSTEYLRKVVIGNNSI